MFKKPRYVIAEVHHFEHGPVITASSAEWSLKRQLYRYRDLFGLRCVLFLYNLYNLTYALSMFQVCR